MEAEAIWGIQLKTLFEEIFNLEHELFTSVRHHIELINPETPVPSRDAIINIEKKRRYIMYDNLSEEPDEFKLELISAIEKIENYLKPKLSHK
jgi:hypothetical protein